MWLKRLFALVLVPLLIFLPTNPILANDSDIHDERKALFLKTEAITNIPWYYFAAIDNYERNKQTATGDEPVLSVTFTEAEWYGVANFPQNSHPAIIELFQGIGQDGNGDGMASLESAEDVLYTLGNEILKEGPTAEDIKIFLWKYYQRDLSVKSIMNTAKVFQHFNDISLTDRSFPVDTNYNYSYRNTWGDRRGYGGLRIHEGTDIFAGYGTPIHATTYGVVELMGWNRFGGWRIGIRDIYNIYHYYAHLSGYEENLEIGQIVKPGDALGTVGSTGYGPPGTAGKFPPHLHYGMYKDDGYSEWSFDPYPYLNRWEKMSKQK